MSAVNIGIIVLHLCICQVSERGGRENGSTHIPDEDVWNEGKNLHLSDTNFFFGGGRELLYCIGGPVRTKPRNAAWGQGAHCSGGISLTYVDSDDCQTTRRGHSTETGDSNATSYSAANRKGMFVGQFRPTPGPCSSHTGGKKQGETETRWQRIASTVSGRYWSEFGTGRYGGGQETIIRPQAKSGRGTKKWNSPQNSSRVSSLKLGVRRASAEREKTPASEVPESSNARNQRPGRPTPVGLTLLATSPAASTEANQHRIAQDATRCNSGSDSLST